MGKISNKMLKEAGIQIRQRIVKHLSGCVPYFIEAKRGVKHSGIVFEIALKTDPKVVGVKEARTMYVLGIGNASYKAFVLQMTAVVLVFDQEGLYSRLKSVSSIPIKALLQRKTVKKIEEISGKSFAELLLEHFNALQDGMEKYSTLKELSKNPYVSKFIEPALPKLKRVFEDILLEVLNKHTCKEETLRKVLRPLSIDLWYFLFGKEKNKY